MDTKKLLDDNDEEFYEQVNYRELLKLQPKDFYLHYPWQFPFLKWLYEVRLQLLLMMNIDHNYFAMRHRLDGSAQWFADWVFLIHYKIDYESDKTWKPNIYDKIRFKWLMFQGYKKEEDCYIALYLLKESGKATVQDRKFLRQYNDCRYSSYIDSRDNEELAFFGLGLTKNISLEDEDQPLFPNIAYSYPDDPRLSYYSGSKATTEFIPTESSWWVQYKAKRSITKKWDRKEVINYADIRPLFNSETTKIHDMEFLLHYFENHIEDDESSPEKDLYDQIYPMYGIEILHLAQMMHIPQLDKLNISHPRRKINPLYIAYKQRWFDKNPVKDFEKVFHGVTKEQYQKIVNKQYKTEKLTKMNKRQAKHKRTKVNKLDKFLKKVISYSYRI